MFDLRKLLKRGIEVEKLERSKEEKAKTGQLRGGNTGYLVGKEVRGKCAREAVLRYHGVDKEFPISRSIMFSAGEKMEDILIDKLTKAHDGEILSQEEAGIKWDCNGVPVTGRPDIVLADKNKVPQFGIECKMISSYWTMRSVSPFSFVGGVPKADHLAQACHYMWQLGQKHGMDYVDWALVYVCPNDYHIHTKDIRETGERFEELKRNEKGSVFKAESHITIYYLTLYEDGHLRYRCEHSTKEIPTEISIDGIKNFYGMVVESLNKKVMPPRMVNTDAAGNKLTWDRYDPAYNDYATLHDAYDKGIITFDEFIKQAKEIK